jgi:uncharacterized RDD family membrane protein YckC
MAIAPLHTPLARRATMADGVHFETPENILVQYHPAGLGTRFYAWVLDQVLVFLVLFLGFIAVVVLAAVFEEAAEAFGETIAPYMPDDTATEKDIEQFGFVIVGFFFLLYGLGATVYFGLSELFLRGQTYGKRQANIRVVKAGGFALDPVSIFLRNIFRVIDHMPPLWIVPFLSPKGQRFGDMVSGTVVVTEGEAKLGGVRAALAEREPTDALHHFDSKALAALSAADVAAIEKVLERFAKMKEQEQAYLLSSLTTSVRNKMGLEQQHGTIEANRRFLEDLLAATYRHRERKLR